MKTTYIYTLSDNTGIRYVGKSDNPYIRLIYHKKECKKQRSHKEKWLYSMIQSNSEIILEILDEVPIEMWCQSEIYWIGQLKAWGFKLVNGTTGGEGSDGFRGKKHTDKTKELCGKNSTSFILTQEMRDKISHSNKNRIISKASRLKMSNKAKLRPRVGISLSNDIKNNISEGVKRYWQNKKRTETDEKNKLRN